MKGTVIIRAATPADAEAIWDVKRASWLATYPNAELGLTVGGLWRRLDGEHGEKVAPGLARLRERITLAAGEYYLVAEQTGVVIGMTSPLIEATGRHRVGALYLDPDVTGRGIGHRLLEANLDWHGQGTDVYLNVAGYNARAIRFYERHGFIITGPVPDENAGDGPAIPELEMALLAHIAASGQEERKEEVREP